ncbi:hypothetical protein GCM10010435_10510 [Winogradskya consettensis]|uniref:Uncharacterized protein n=1 Tax=Winogradskya consettensis TaxID=113560 RepID=A0A919T1J7_9ACTN|nr:hypothetical protein [Actinoplanes consettensis]GIM81516.1 hypothetical protein Aco04nite_76930 [Actinoplanes consettensis]
MRAPDPAPVTPAMIDALAAPAMFDVLAAPAMFDVLAAPAMFDVLAAPAMFDVLVAPAMFDVLVAPATIDMERRVTLRPGRCSALRATEINPKAQPEAVDSPATGGLRIDPWTNTPAC